MLVRWDRFTRFLDDGRIFPSRNNRPNGRCAASRSEESLGSSQARSDGAERAAFILRPVSSRRSSTTSTHSPGWPTSSPASTTCPRKTPPRLQETPALGVEGAPDEPPPEAEISRITGKYDQFFSSADVSERQRSAALGPRRMLTISSVLLARVIEGHHSQDQSFETTTEKQKGPDRAQELLEEIQNAIESFEKARED